MRIQPLSEDLINEIGKLQVTNRFNFYADEVKNPISALVTPEWFYSDGYKIFSDSDITWESLEGIDNLIHSLANDVSQITVESLTNSGQFEVSFCSWYQSYHYAPKTRWGIHIRSRSWLRIAAYLNQTCPNLLSDPVGSVKAAFLYLLMHELFHHIVENGTSIMEIVLQNSEIYTSYISSVYAQVFNSHECLEESLANSFLLTASDICHIEKRYLEDELLNQGPGYNDFVHYIEPSKFRKGVRRLISQIRTGKLHPPVELPIEQVMNISNPIDYLHISNVPIWIHKRANPIHYDLYNGTCTPSC